MTKTTVPTWTEGLSRRAAWRLAAAGCRSRDDARRAAEKGLSALPGIGPVICREIHVWLGIAV